MTKQERAKRDEEIYIAFQTLSFYEWICHGYTRLTKRLCKKYRLTPSGIRKIRMRMIETQRLMEVVSGELDLYSDR